MTADPAEALRRIRARVVVDLTGCQRTGDTLSEIAFRDALDIIDEEWPNGVELNPVAVDPPDHKPLTIATTDARLVATMRAMIDDFGPAGVRHAVDNLLPTPEAPS